MNTRDSEVICGLLKQAGYKIAEKPEDAEVVLFNTCSVRQHAEDKVWSEIGRFKGATPIIGIVGCMAQNYKEKIFQRAPAVDFVVGPADIDKIPEILKKIGTVPKKQSLFSRKIWETDGEKRPDEIYHTGFYEDKEQAYVVISEGCSNYCSYCVVPYARGELQNRKADDILKEITAAADKGIAKITLLGQNVNAYQSEGASFAKLISMINEIKGIQEFGFITSHPKDTSMELLETLTGLKKFNKFLHLPVQSGSDRILKLMNRKYTRKDYLSLAQKYRALIPDGALTTDIIVGFPGESEKDFQDTYDLVNETQFNAAYIFKYSPRPHTAAENMADDVPIKEKERRHGLILELQKKISKNKKILFLICSLMLGILSNASAMNLDNLKAKFLSADYKAAIAEGEKIISNTKEPADKLDELYYILGLSYLKDGNYLRASDIFEIILNEFDQSIFKEEALLGLADSYFLKEDFPKAQQYYQQLLSQKPESKYHAIASERLSQIEIRTGQAEGISYTVQVGAFKSKLNATRLMQKLISNKFPAYMEELNSGDSVSYRVRIGKMNQLKEAQELKEKLEKKGYAAKIFP